MSDRNRGRKPSQMANKAKRGMQDQETQRIERDMDRMSDEDREMERRNSGMKQESSGKKKEKLHR